jgi:hypothetical protein
MAFISKQSPIIYILGFCGVIALIAVGIILFVYEEEDAVKEKVPDPQEKANAVCNCIEQLQATPLKIEDNKCYRLHKAAENELEEGIPLEKYNASLSKCVEEMQPRMSSVELAKWERPNLVVDEGSPLTTNRITGVQNIGGTAVVSIFLDYFCQREPVFKHEVKKKMIKIRLKEPPNEEKILCTEKRRKSHRLEDIPPGSYSMELYHWNHDLPVDKDEVLIDLR